MLPSLNDPLAVNLMDVPFAMCALAGFTLMAVSFAIETVKVVDPLTKPELADIVVVPVAKLVTSP